MLPCMLYTAGQQLIAYFYTNINLQRLKKDTTLLILILTAIFFLKSLDQQVYAQTEEVDVLVYGATPAGVAASVAASREGMNVLLVEPSSHFGGIMTGGMSNPDFKTFEALGSFYKEFMDSVVSHYSRTYGPGSQQLHDSYRGVWYEPHVAHQIFTNLINKNQVTLLMEARLEDVVLNNGDDQDLLEAVKLSKSNGEKATFRAKVFIDATYEGDLMAAAGVSYRVGREPRTEYGELFAGVKYFSREHKFLPGSTGQGDHKIQCYNFRLCMTDSAENRITVKKPENYDRSQYGRLLELIESGQVGSLHDVLKFRYIPNRKADINDPLYSPFGIRLMEAQHDWPEGNSATRADIFQQHKAFTLGLLYFMQNDAAVPDTIRSEASQWGFAKDEFEETNGFSPALYIREGRRMLGDFVLTEHDTQPAVPGQIRAVLHPDAVAICDYSMDSHGNGAPIPFHPGVTEGAFNFYVQPYQLPYAIMLPPQTNGLLVPVAVSASHVAYSSLRMEPTWTSLGYAAGLAAAQSVKEQVAPRSIKLEQLQQNLHNHKALTVYISDVLPGDDGFEAAQYLGTKGYFHNLPQYQGVPYIGRGSGKEMRGQHIAAYPYHAIEPDRPMDAALANRWNEKAGTTLDYEGKSRLLFLKELYQNLVKPSN